MVALCQFLPGPASSQVGIGIGTIRAGIGGGIISFIGFTIPSVIMLMIFSMLFTNSDANFTWIQGLKLVAVAIVAQAIIGMGKKLTNTKTTITLALFVLILALIINNLYIQVIALLITGVYGLIFLRKDATSRNKIKNKTFNLPKKLGLVSFIYFLLLTVLPIASSMTNNLWLKMFDSFYRSGSLVFGGGHVVLPLLKNEFVSSGLISNFITLCCCSAVRTVILRLLHTLVCLWKGLEEQFWLLLLFFYLRFFCYLEFCHSGIILSLIYMLKAF